MAYEVDDSTFTAERIIPVDEERAILLVRAGQEIGDLAIEPNVVISAFQDRVTREAKVILRLPGVAVREAFFNTVTKLEELHKQAA